MARPGRSAYTQTWDRAQLSVGKLAAQLEEAGWRSANQRQRLRVLWGIQEAIQEHNGKNWLLQGISQMEVD